MICPVYSYTKKDRFIAAVLAAVILLLCLGSLNYDCIWGDDSAAYISEGIAIADGTFKEHVKLNPMLHPSYLGGSVKDELVYVWGYPLLLSAVYRLAGFDTENYSSIIYYKLPSALFLAVMACCFFLLLRRRFSLGVSAFVTCFFSSSPLFTENVNSLYSDTVYMGMCMLTLLVLELYLEEKERKRQTVKALILGVLIWYSAEVRTNGTVFIAVLLTAQIAELVHEKNFSKKRLLPLLLPYAVFFILKFVTERILLRPVTPNSADFSLGSPDFIAMNTLYYITELFDFTTELITSLFNGSLGRIIDPEKYVELLPAVFAFSKGLAGLTMLMAVLGIFTRGLKQNQYLTLYVLGCAVGACLLSFNQGLRYLLGIMPIMALFAVYGYERAFSRLLKKRAGTRRHRPVCARIAMAAVTVLLCAVSCSAQYRLDSANIRRLRANGENIHAGSEGMYSPCAIEVYDYIKKETPGDAVIAFHKPRALYLNTGRPGFSYLVNGHDAMDADYCILPELFYDSYTEEEAPEWFSSFEVVLRNEELTVMKKISGKSTAGID